MHKASAGTVPALGNSVHSSHHSRIPPAPHRMVVALRQVGYSFEQAISDLIDNSINAGASKVLIRFICDEVSIRSCVIADDGKGISASRMVEAMKFGSTEEQNSRSLGKYGMGLKLASLSQATRFSLISRHNGIVHGRRWTVEGISKGWECETLRPSDALAIISAPWNELDLSRSGTLVVWEEIDRLPAGGRGLKNLLRGLHTRLEVHLGMCFHRFLESGSLRILLDQQRMGNLEHSIAAEIEPLNPFSYPHSGEPSYPKIFKAQLPEIGTIEGEAHIWPPNSDSEAYKLGNKAAARQGFYFYRNNRLIQAGGWNGVVQHETEPHSSLARIKIDLPVTLDASFGLNVQKSTIIVPPVFQEAMTGAVADDGESFEGYRRAAQLVYRKDDGGGRRLKPLVPRHGLPKRLHLTAAGILAPNGKDMRPVDFEWTHLPPSELFTIGEDAILLNVKYRKKIVAGLSVNGAGAALFKLMLFLLLRNDLDKDRSSVVRRRHIDQLNRLLSEAAGVPMS